MKPYVSDPDFTLYLGDVRDVLRELPDASVDCVATSPPFYALRDYGVEGQIGLEETPELWVKTLVGVFAECRHVLSDTGTLWVECGDSYASKAPGTFSGSTLRAGRLYDGDRKLQDNIRAGLPDKLSYDGIKPKDMLGTPWMLAFALRADGWWLRQCIVWHKPNAMPESATDRCTTAHSYVFLLSKSARYHFDAEAIAEPAEWARWGDQTVPKYEGTDTSTGWMQPKSKRELMALSDHRYDGLVGQKWRKDGRRPDQKRTEHELPGTRSMGGRIDTAVKNPRSVWTIPTQGFSEAHFATWPEALVERIIKAGCPEGGTVLDPFMGSGTTALVARRLGRKSIGIELNESYAALAAKRLQQLSLLAEEPAA